jgi:hypothetical protein
MSRLMSRCKRDVEVESLRDLDEILSQICRDRGRSMKVETILNEFDVF